MKNRAKLHHNYKPPGLSTLLSDNHRRRRGTEVAQGVAQPLPESGQIRPASGALARLLPRTAAAHHRRRTAAPAAGHRHVGRAALPETAARLRLCAAPALRREEGLLLSGPGQDANEVPGQVEGQTVPADGRAEYANVAEVSLVSSGKYRHEQS